ncbi:MAG: hypothetical protein ABMA64_25875 [Myxococcota bacterium]
MRLERVERLHRGATTSGEREAAAAARERLLQHLAQVRADDPIARFCAEHVAELAVPPEPPPPPEHLPDTAAVLAILARWEAGELPSAKVRAWAARLVDRVVLPADPNAEDTPLAEVLLQLAALPHVRLVPSDVPHVRRFLRDRDWSAWFALIERAALRRPGVTAG